MEANRRTEASRKVGMTDREKVIRGLECVYHCISPVSYTCRDCPYQDNRVGCKRRAISDALAMLKEQDKKCDDCQAKAIDEQDKNLNDLWVPK